MTNGPPTPPPTTATELQDEARGNSIVPPPVSTAPTKHDPYQHIFPAIADLASQSNFQDLIQNAEIGDLNGDSDRQSTRLLIATPLVLAYLIVDNLPPARYVFSRLPDSLLATPLVKSLLGLVASTWDRKHANVYTRAESLFKLVEQPDFFDRKLATVILGMVTTFVESFRQRTFILLSKAYTSLPLSLAQTYLGLPSDQLLIVAERAGWSYSTSTNILVPGASTTNSSTVKPDFSSLSTFHFVADSVAKLEL